MNKRQSALLRIMELEFAAIDLNLFLDTHPDDRCALTDFAAVSQELMRAKSEFEARYGPLMNFGFGLNEGNTWRWIESRGRGKSTSTTVSLMGGRSESNVDIRKEA